MVRIFVCIVIIALCVALYPNMVLAQQSDGPDVARIWFSPRQPEPFHPYLPPGGCADYMELFQPDAPWQQAASHVSIFDVHGPMLIYAPDDYLRQIIADMKRRGIQLSTAGEPLIPAEQNSHEGFDVGGQGIRSIERFISLGANISYISLDEPMANGCIGLENGQTVYDMPMQQAMSEIIDYIRRIKQISPNTIVGDGEPTNAGFDTIKKWIDIWQQMTGSPMPFLFLDMTLDSPKMQPVWWVHVLDLEHYARARHVRIGLIIDGLHNTSDQVWMSEAGQMMDDYLKHGGRPDDLAFMSWEPYPSHALPESNPLAMTSLIDDYWNIVQTRSYLPIQGTSAVPRILPGNLLIDPNNSQLWTLRQFNGTVASVTQDEDAIRITTQSTSADPSDVALVRLGIPLTEGQRYLLQFTAKTDSPQVISVTGIYNKGDFHNVGLDSTFALTQNWQTFMATFVAHDIQGYHQNLPKFELGLNDGAVWIKDVSLAPAS